MDDEEKNISPAISKQDTDFRESIPAKIRLAVTLRYLVTGDSYRSLHYTFKISSIEWSYDDCQNNISRRSSRLTPDDESESCCQANVPTIDTKNLVQDITRELKKTFRDEISSLQASLKFLGDQITALKSTKQQDKGINDFENEKEIAGLPEVAPIDIPKVAVAHNLDMNKLDAQSYQKLLDSQDKPGPILVEMKIRDIKQLWVNADKKCASP
ncbi:unnamed protein product [Arctia plantaginis]|uniref:Uncharacterized protein n=1 Tax=Arctia plantaginis TaxID=874455 RepID=A0A8S1AAD7_ARCPL|nr:unnamed protein product [Arctia plantaginis]